MPLTQPQKRFLRSRAHSIKSIVMIGSAGLTPAVIRELDLSLAHHELLKVRVNAGDREARKAIIERMCAETQSTLIQGIGHVAVLYRPAKHTQIPLPRC